jgi:hypothetical protein
MKSLPILVLLAACTSGVCADCVYDAGYCPPEQRMPMPQICYPNNPCNTGNNLHIGAYCTQNGGQCAQYGLICGLDADSMEGKDFCILLCSHDADCGDGGDACCTGDPKNLHPSSQRACVPNSCPNKVCDGG